MALNYCWVTDYLELIVEFLLMIRFTALLLTFPAIRRRLLGFLKRGRFQGITDVVGDGLGDFCQFGPLLFVKLLGLVRLPGHVRQQAARWKEQQVRS